MKNIIMLEVEASRNNTYIIFKECCDTIFIIII